MIPCSLPRIPIALALTLALTLALAPLGAPAFVPPRASQDGLTLRLHGPGAIDLTAPAIWTFEAGVVARTPAAPTVGELVLTVTEGWAFEATGTTEMREIVTLSADDQGATVTATIRPFGPVYAAHYALHARFHYHDGASGERRTAHVVQVFEVTALPPAPAPALHRVLSPGVTALSDLPWSVRIDSASATHASEEKAHWTGVDAATGAQVERQRITRPGGALRAIAVHPPWRQGWGTATITLDLSLPPAQEILLALSTAIRDHSASEPPSDGVAFIVRARPIDSNSDGETLTFDRFSDAKAWTPARLDLSPLRGRRVALELITDPGPNRDTTCDQAYWGNPLIIAGDAIADPHEAPARQEARLRDAARRVRDSDANDPGAVQHVVGLGDDVHRFQIFPGPHGLADGVIALSQGDRTLYFSGFTVEIDHIDITLCPVATEGLSRRRDEDGRETLTVPVLHGGRRVPVEMTVFRQGDALRFGFHLPGQLQSAQGSPRLTRVALGPAVTIAPGAGADALPVVSPARAERVFAGLGNVMVRPERFELRGDGFHLSTSHVGVEYEAGFHVVQAMDHYPERFRGDPDAGLYSLETSNNCVLSLIPSSRGAFAAARTYREQIAGFQPAPGLAALRGRVCLDYWGTRYEHGLRTIEQLAQLGARQAVLVWHNWQRWGYDYRLPEIYPARDNHDAFLRLSELCRRHDILFAPHDNYIDFYPDAEGFAYQHIIFNDDGTPQRAWFNEGRQAQSYRWAPHAYFPWMLRNIRLIQQDIRPTAYFTDVFVAIAPMDWRDATGRFHPRVDTIALWRQTFDALRHGFDGAPQISEAGHDSQIGHVDAGQSDHMGVNTDPAVTASWTWNIACEDAQRVPWHDMATHGRFILYAGGLANRYVGALDQRQHGYGSDDYMSLTVLGGRAPMAHLDVNAATLRTFWQLQAVCEGLGDREMLEHHFADGDIHRQQVVFASSAEVFVNRGETDWTVDDHILPPFGFIARAGDAWSDVTLRGGRRTGFAQAGGALFADARPDLTGDGDTPVIDFGPVATNSAFRLERGDSAWTVLLLPGAPGGGSVRLNMDALEAPSPTPAAVAPLRWEDLALVEGEERAVAREGNWLTVETADGDAGYRIRF